MSGNTFGKIFSVTTFGESHGEAMGCIIDGCPPNFEIKNADIQMELDRRKLSSIKLHLDIRIFYFKIRWTSVNYAAHSFAMTFTKSRYRKDFSKCVT